MLRNTLTIIIALLSALSFAQQSPKKDIETAASQPTIYHHTHYDDHNGMSQWHITRILQDAQGFMWFATWNGLNRFDGYEFAVFKSRPGDGTNLTSDRIRNMMLGKDGHIYCIINDHVWRFNLTTYRFEEPDDATKERFFARFKMDTVVHPEADITVGDSIYKQVRQVFVDSQGNKWVMGLYGVEKVSVASQPAQRVDGVPRDIIRSLFVDQKKRIWVACRNTRTVAVLNQQAQLIGYLGPDGRLHREPVSFYSIYAIAQQRNGTLWLGGKPSGLFRLTETQDGIFSITHISRTSDKDVSSGKSLNNNNIYDIKEDHRGRLWIATHGGGLNMIENPNTAADADGSVRLKIHNPDNTMRSYPRNNLIIRRLKIVGDSIIIATTTEGLVVAMGMNGPTDKMTFNLHLRESNRATSLSSSATMDMVIDRKGRLFISTESGGVNMLTTKSLSSPVFDFLHYKTDNGMGSDVALAMTEVGDELLIQCNNLVTRLNVDLNEIENFNNLFFSLPLRFSDAEPVLLPDGRWIITTESGLLLVPEQMFHQHSYVPRIVMTSYSVPGRETNYTANVHDTIVLTSRERNLTVNFAALDYTYNNHIKYISRLLPPPSLWHGNDSVAWSAPSEARNVSYYDLKPGTYTLQVRSTNAKGLWADNVHSVTIIVKPMFWETTLAYIIYILLFIGIVSGITYTVAYIRTLKRQREDNLKAYLRLFEQMSAGEMPSNVPDDNVSPGDNAADDASSVTASASNTPAPQQQVVVASPHLSEEDDAFMRRLMSFVEENISVSSIGVEEMASATATSRSSLNRRMKTLLGVTPADFLREARMKLATQQLLTTSKSINDIAYSCGFSDPKYFSKCFKSSLGISPSEYRTQGKE